MRGRALGYLFVLLAAVLWGVSGTAADVLFHRFLVSPMWLTEVRLWGSGIVLFALLALVRPVDLRLRTRDLTGVLVYGAFGFFLVQFSYFAAIFAAGVAVATFLQYLGPALIVIYAALRARRVPQPHELIALALTLAGTWLLVAATEGRPISVPGLLWGLLAAVSLAFNTLYPLRLIGRLGPWATSCYAFIVGGLVASAVSSVVHAPMPHLSVGAVLLIAFVVLFGTLLPFSLYVSAIGRLHAAEAGIVSTAEPLAAALAAAIVLGQRLSLGQYLGGVLIVLAVAVLAALPRSRMPDPRVEHAGTKGA